MSPWESLVKYYDNLVTRGEKVCPIAHTYISINIAVLISQDGKFLYAMEPKVKSELVPVPCTVESETRTSNIAPHLISDQLQYVSDYPGYAKHHREYVRQLEEYVTHNPGDKYVNAVYLYIKNGTLLSDIQDFIGEKNNIPKNRLNVLFAVYGLPNEGADMDWTNYYINDVLKVTGRCSITGEVDYLPKAYPNGILSQVDIGKLFIAKTDSYGEYAQIAPGYIASQKIIRALQYMIYAKRNADRVEAEYAIRGFLDGSILIEDFKTWMDEKYPQCWDELLKMIEKDKEKVAES